MANKRFTSIKNDFCITFDMQTAINEVAEDRAIKQEGFSFTKLDMLSNVSPGSTIDVIGVVMEVGQVGSVNLKTGESRQKRELKVADESNAMISITLWGDVATAQNFNTGDIYALRGCRVSDYAGRSLNASSSPGDLIANVKHPRSVAIS